MARDDGVPGAVRCAGGALGALAAGALAVEYLPALVAIGQWGRLRALPGGLCRWRGSGLSRRIALTFDDGPDPEGTPRVLDALDHLGLRATFFVLGEHVRRDPGLVEEVAARGHQLGSHGDVHSSHFLRSPAWVGRDLRRARDAMAALGHAPRWYRPAYGHATGATLAVARTMGLETVLWSSSGREWVASGSAEVAGGVRQRLGPGAIVLLHDSDRFGPRGMSRLVADALPFVADELRRRDLEAVRLDELLDEA
ncbi:MAG: polysaccharide deacetylase family protein [Actinomycetota bacterium]|jgi:peptidoglycan/xylan/chitin deacetylase (PgdA/CDA1 family)|nr:polysaccharide deacetylase family protein [Actinomycetota bacterium]